VFIGVRGVALELVRCANAGCHGWLAQPCSNAILSPVLLTRAQPSRPSREGGNPVLTVMISPARTTNSG